MKISHPTLGSPTIAASVEFARRPIALEPELLGLFRYRFTVTTVSRFRLCPLSPKPEDVRRETQRATDERHSAEICTTCNSLRIDPSTRRSSVDCGSSRSGEMLSMITAATSRSIRPTHCGHVTNATSTLTRFRALTRPVDIPGWEARVRPRFQFIADLDADEARWAACDPRHRSEVDEALVALAS